MQTCITYIHTYIHTYIDRYVRMYIHTYMHTNITLHYITLHYITLHCITYIHTHIHTYIHTYITLHYITLHYITLHYITLSLLNSIELLVFQVSLLQLGCQFELERCWMYTSLGVRLLLVSIELEKCLSMVFWTSVACCAAWALSWHSVCLASVTTLDFRSFASLLSRRICASISSWMKWLSCWDPRWNLRRDPGLRWAKSPIEICQFENNEVNSRTLTKGPSCTKFSTRVNSARAEKFATEVATYYGKWPEMPCFLKDKGQENGTEAKH